MATTPNYGWVTPAPTDFVTDLPADFETFADAVDADLAGLLGGTTGQVLTKDSASDHDFSWVTPAGATSITEIATATPSSATTVSFTSIPTTYKDLIVLWDNVLQNANGNWYVRINNDSGTNYTYSGVGVDAGSHGVESAVGQAQFGNAQRSAAIVDAINTTANRLGAGFFKISQADTTRNHNAQWGGFGFNNSNQACGAILQNGIWYNASAITQIDFIRSSTQTISGNFYLFGVK